MTKRPLPLYADDLTSFARALSRQLGDTSPSHLSLMNMLARAAGYQNVQHMRGAQAAGRRLDRAQETTPPNSHLVERTLNQFDADGRLRQWPSKRGVQTLALWALWSVLPAGATFQEKELNARLVEEHLFGDPATLRRTMISCGLLTREVDGSDYRRVEQAPPPDAKAVIAALGPRRAGRAEVTTPETRNA